MAFFASKEAKKHKPANELQLISCPAFSRLVGDYSEEEKYRILDLGGAQAANVAFFNRYRCKLYIGDVVPSLMALQADLDEEEEIQELDLAEMLEFDDISSQNLILCWDIFNYLDRRLLTPFSSALAGLLRENGCVHAFIHTHQNMPSTPGIYQIEDEGRMQAVFPGTDQMPAPRYPQRELERLMPGLKVKQSHLLQSGMQEYLFVRHGA